MTRLNKDLLSGLTFIGIGSAFLWIGWGYAIGTPFRMGPGYFPRMLSIALVALGVLIAIKGLIAKAEGPGALYWRPLVLVTISVVAFGALITTAGLLPACLAVVLLGALGGPEFHWLEALILAALLTAAAVALFIYGLGMPLAIVHVPSF